jgi:hypothetical protein
MENWSKSSKAFWFCFPGHYAFEVTQKRENALKAGMANLELGPTKNYMDSLPAPETIGPCTPVRSGGGNFQFYNGIQGNSDLTC